MNANIETITHKTRKVIIERAETGFGFVLRGAKADGPISEFTPCPTCPAVQYLESVDQSGPAWSSGLRPGDFIIEINGISVIRAGHRQAVELIRSTTGTLRLTATSVVNPKKDESRTATVKQRPQSRTYGTAEIQDILARQQSATLSTSGYGTLRSGQSKDKPRIPKIPDTIGYGSPTTNSIINSRSISPSPSTNSDNSSSSKNSEKTERKKPPPPKRLQSRLLSTSSETCNSRHASSTSPPPISPPVVLKHFPAPPLDGADLLSCSNLDTFKSPPGMDEIDRLFPDIPSVCSPVMHNDVLSVANETNTPYASQVTEIKEHNLSKLHNELIKDQKNKITDIESECIEESLPKKDYSNIKEIDCELEEIKKKTNKTDPHSAFAIAMSAKHKTLTKRRDKLKRNIPSIEEISNRLKQNVVLTENKSITPSNEVAKSEDLHYSSEESGSNEVMRRFLESPSKYPFDIPEPILDSGVETIGSNSTGSDREEAKHQQFLQLKQTLKARSSVTSWSCVDVCDWLTDHGFGQYALNFQENEIEGVHLATLTRNDLTELGVQKIGHKLSIMKLIETVKSNEAV